MNWYKLSIINSGLTKTAISWRQLRNSLLTGTLAVSPVIVWIVQKSMNVPAHVAIDLIETNPQGVAESIDQNPKLQETISRMPDKWINSPKTSVPQAVPQVQQPQEMPKPAPKHYGLIRIQDIKPQIERHEGRSHRVYPDTKNIPTIGVGFNLNREDAPQVLAQIGVDYKNLMNGKVVLNDGQINKLLDICLNKALTDAQSFLPDLGSYPPNVQRVIVDMSFTLGRRGLSRFVNLKSALLKRDFQTAADEMIKSDWYSDVKSRGPTLVNMMRSAK